MHTKIKFLFVIEDSVDPIAVIHVHWINVVSLDYIIVDFSRLTNHLIRLTSVLGDNVVRCRVDHIALHLAQILRHVKPKLAPLIVMEVLLRRDCLLFLTTFLHSGEKFAHLSFCKLGLSQDQDHLILSWVPSEASQEPDGLGLSILVEDASESELPHAETHGLDRVLFLNNFLCPLVAFLLQLSDLSLNQGDFLADALLLSQGHGFSICESSL